MSPPEQWQLAGSAPETYERHVVPALFMPWARSLIKDAALRPGERVLDIACGTGVVTLLAAGRVGSGGQVVGLDLNAGMLAMARSRPAPAGARIEWKEGSALALPFTDGSFDIALCQQGLQFFPDRPLALGEMRRVLAPGGRVALSVWRSIDRSPGFLALATALERHAGAEAAAIMRAPFALNDAAELARLTADAGFSDVAVRAATDMVRWPSAEAFVEHQPGATPLAGIVAALAPQAREALRRDVVAALRAHAVTDGVAWPVEAHVVTARR